ncbi:MAG TPA: XdhC family protein [Desulfosporosinus sp.]|nr:XdhC family protein [Desulfosporosinus sp.]
MANKTSPWHIVNFLKEKGYTSQSLACLRAPIGLDIHAQTPSEIAISILAEIISVKRSLSSTQY